MNALFITIVSIFLMPLILFFFIPLYRANRNPNLRKSYLIICSFSSIWFPPAWACIWGSEYMTLAGVSILWMLFFMFIYFPIARFVIKTNNKSLELSAIYWMIGNCLWFFCMLFFLGFMGAVSSQ